MARNLFSKSKDNKVMGTALPLGNSHSETKKNDCLQHRFFRATLITCNAVCFNVCTTSVKTRTDSKIWKKNRRKNIAIFWYSGVWELPQLLIQSSSNLMVLIFQVQLLWKPASNTIIGKNIIKQKSILSSVY